jgi:hypothetical protein
VADGTDQLIVDSRDAAETNQRAWIAPIAVILGELPKVGEKITLIVRYENSGKEPALGAVSINQAFPIKMPPPNTGWDTVRFGNNPTCDGLKTLPGAQVIYPYSTRGYQDLFSTKWDADGEIENGIKTLYTRGCYAYETYGKTRYSAYCFYMLPKPGRPKEEWMFGGCADGNSAT